MDELELLQRREADRSVLIGDLKMVIFEKEEEFIGDANPQHVERLRLNFFLALATCFIDQEVEQKSGRDFFGLITQKHWIYGISFFVSQEIGRAIQEFTKVEEERSVINLALAQFAFEQITRPFDSKMLRLNMPPARAGFLQKVGLLPE